MNGNTEYIAPKSGCKTVAANVNSDAHVFFQPKLTVNNPNDVYEQEADAVADRVMRMVVPGADRTSFFASSPVVMQRKCQHCEEERIYRKATRHNLPEVDLGFERYASSLANGGVSLTQADRDFFEPRFKQDFSHVRIHTGFDAAASADQIHARAYTLGNNIVFNSGEYRPGSARGRALIAHELVHTIQQGNAADGHIQRSVDEVVINCSDGLINFVHDQGQTSYSLDSCDVSEGSYDANVVLSENHVHFDLGDDVPVDRRFNFNYSIGPGQESPNTFFVGQQTVRILCTDQPGQLTSGTYHFNATRLSEADFLRLTGSTVADLPSGVMVPLSQLVPEESSTPSSVSAPSVLAPAVTGASIGYSSPFSFIPANSTGVLWTQGHTSIWANPQEALLPTIRGYRGALPYYIGEMLPGGRSFTIRLHEGVPGSFANDILFPFNPGEQTYLYTTRSPGDANAFAARLRATTYGGTYTYSPPRSAPDSVLGGVGRSEGQLFEVLTNRGRAPMRTNNCITVPGAEIEGAIGRLPTTPGGVDVQTGTSRDGTVDPHHRGRGRLMGDAVLDGDLSPGVGRLHVTPGGARAMFVIRGAGGIMLVYGIYHTGERIHGAVGTDQLGTVVAEETGSWAGGILGSALGGAAAGAIVCAPTGPIDAVCVVGGFLGGLLFGAIGSAVGSEVGHTAATGRPPESGILDTLIVAPFERNVLAPLGELHNYMDYEIRNLYGVGAFPF